MYGNKSPIYTDRKVTVVWKNKDKERKLENEQVK